MCVPENLLCGWSVSGMKNAKSSRDTGHEIGLGPGAHGTYWGSRGCFTKPIKVLEEVVLLQPLWNWGQGMTGWGMDVHVSCSKTV